MLELALNERNYLYPTSVSGQRVSVYDTDSTPKFWPGTRFVAHNNRVFRYAWNGGVAQTAALMGQGEAPDTSHLIDQVQTGHAVTKGQVSFQVLVATGSGLTASTVSHLIGGTLIVEELATAVSPETRAANGDIYTIVNAAWYTSDTILQITVSSPVRNSWPVATKLTLIKSPYMDTIVSPATTPTSIAIGVPLVDVPINYGYWAQTKGLAPAYISGTVVIGQSVGVSGTAGGFGPVADTNVLTTTTQIPLVWGRAVQIAANTKYGIVDLMLE